MARTGIDGRPRRRGGRGLAVLLMTLSLAACAAGVPGERSGRDGFPNLNVPLQPAAAQLTPAERASGNSSLTATRAWQDARTAQAQPANAAAELRATAARRAGQAGERTGSADELRALGQRHGEERLRRIEGR